MNSFLSRYFRDNQIYSYPTLVFIVVFCLLFTGIPLIHAKKNKVLVLHSYHHGFEWTDQVMIGIESVFNNSDIDVELRTEYMDTKSYKPERVFPLLQEIYKIKYHNLQPDIIISSDNNALNFLLPNRDLLFPGVPIVFCGINNYSDSLIKNQVSITGVAEDFDFEGTIGLALRLHPETRQIAVVSDSTHTAIVTLERLKRSFSKFTERVSFVELTDMTAQGFKEALNHLPDNALVIHNGLFRDRNGRKFTLEEGLSFVVKNSQVPVYSLWQFMIDQGVMGGVVVSGFSQGKQAALMAVRILQGALPDRIPVLKTSPNVPIFDYNVMLQFGINKSDLPEDSIVLNIPDSFYASYKNVFWMIVVGSATFIFVIIVLFFNITVRKKYQDRLENVVKKRTAELEKDIVVRKQTEKALKEAQQYSRGLIEANLDALVTISAKGKITDVNIASELITGISRKEIIGTDFSNYFTVPDAARKGYQQVFRDGYVRDYPLEIKHSDGKVIPVLYNASVYKDAQGKAAGVFAAARDITEQKKAEKILQKTHDDLEIIVEERTAKLVSTNRQLKQEIEFRKQAKKELQVGEEKFRNLIESSSDWIWEVNAEGIYTYSSPQVEGLLGYNSEEITGKSPFDLLLPEEAVKIAKFFKNAIEKGEPIVALENVNLHKDGRHIILETSGVPVFDKVGKVTGYRGVDRDITVKKELEQVLIKSKEELEFRIKKRTLDLQKVNEKLLLAKNAAEKANKAKSVFLASMSHELRTPLNSILGFAQLLEIKIDKDEKHPHRKYLTRILRSGEHLLNLINEILDLATIESDTMTLSIESVDLCLAVKDAIDVVKPMAKAHEIELLPEAPKEPIFINVDRIKLNQIVLNLLSNAIKYNRPNGSVKIFSEISSNTLRLNITDTGSGIEKDKIGLLFEPFNRLGEETSSIEGTGIGLTITKRLVEMMEGCIGVESELGIGTKFFVEFALAETPVKNQKNIVPTYSMGGGLTGNHTILYIEDNMVNQLLIEAILADHPNITLVTAPTAAQGIEIAVNQRPALILMDISLPDMDGFQAFEQLEKMQETRDIPIVGLSANAMPLDIKKAMDAGFSDYLTKPVNIGEFNRMIANIINDNDVSI